MFACDSADDSSDINPDEGAEPDADAGTDTDECDDSKASWVDEWCLPYGAELCDDLGHFCDPGTTCCTGGCAALGGDCCQDGTYCDPGYSCNGDGTCQRIATEDDPVYVTCAQIDRCFGDCFASVPGPAVASCLMDCEHASSLAALEQFKRYFRCNQDCKENTQSRHAYVQCFDLHCAQLQFDCIGRTIPPD